MMALAQWTTVAQAPWIHELSTSPSRTVKITVSGGYSGGALAGIYNMAVDGKATPAFCIDVFRFSPPGPPKAPTADNCVSLSSAPLSPAGPMGGDAATAIRKLWAAYISGAKSDSSGLAAAALQVAIWKTVDAAVDTYTVTISQNTLEITRANAMIASLSGLTAQADLIGLVNGTFLNCMVATPTREPATMVAGAWLLLPFAASVMRMMRRKA